MLDETTTSTRKATTMAATIRPISRMYSPRPVRTVVTENPGLSMFSDRNRSSKEGSGSLRSLSGFLRAPPRGYDLGHLHLARIAGHCSVHRGHPDGHPLCRLSTVPTFHHHLLCPVHKCHPAGSAIPQSVISPAAS